MASLRADLGRLDALHARLDDLSAAIELEDPDLLEEAATALPALQADIEALEIRTLLSGEYDERDALITINSGTGGTDAADWAEMLMRMYLRWAERHDYPTEVFDTSYAEEAGIKSATFVVKAPFAYGTLAGEHGHAPAGADLARSTTSRGARPRSPSVDVTPVVEQTDHVEIPEDEIRVDVYRSSGPGGQGVNTTDSAVRLTHLPDRHRGHLPERAQPDPEPGPRDGGPAGQAARGPPPGGREEMDKLQGLTQQSMGFGQRATRSATTCCTRTRWSRTRGPRSRSETPVPCSTATSTRSSRPRSAGVALTGITTNGR